MGFRTFFGPHNLELLLRFDTFSGRDDIETAAEANKHALTPAEMTALKSELEALRAAFGDLQTYSSRG